jgi:hypothetical protein
VQAPTAIILAALRRFRGAVLFPGPRLSSIQGAPVWPSGLTNRRSRPPTAAAELRALARSRIRSLCMPPLTPRFRLSQRFGLLGFFVALVFACISVACFKLFWPLAPVPLAPAALSLVALRQCAALFQTASGLTRRCSGSPSATAEISR